MVASNPQLYSSKSKEWYTPPELVRDIVGYFGGIDLDPAARGTQHIPAARHEVVDGLSIPWAGKVYCNPPYGREIGKWTRKALTDPAVDELIMLVPARTDTLWFAPWYRHTVLFIEGRLTFGSPDGTKDAATFPSALLYRGPFPSAFALYFNQWGTCIYPGGTLIGGRESA